VGRRVTIMIDTELDKKVKTIQTERIQTTNRSVSYSKVIDELLQKGLKKE